MIDKIHALFDWMVVGRSKRTKQSYGRTLCVEPLERRDLLAIMWTNKGTLENDSDGFRLRYGESSFQVARAIAQRAVDDWNAVIQNFNYAEDSDTNPNNNLNDTFNLRIEA